MKLIFIYSGIKFKKIAPPFIELLIDEICYNRDLELLFKMNIPSSISLKTSTKISREK